MMGSLIVMILHESISTGVRGVGIPLKKLPTTTDT